MFVCGLCKIQQPPRTPSFNLVVETRPVEYLKENEEGEKVVTKGTEIVRQVKVCPKCASIAALPPNA